MNIIWRNSVEKVSAWGLFLLCFLFYAALLTGIGLLVGFTVHWISVPVAAVLSALTVRLLFPRPDACIAALGGILFIAVVAWANSLVYDTAFDSMGYHYDVSVMMVNGWNPVSQPPFNGSLWAQHYAKVLEMIGAALLSFTGNLQSVKCVNFIFLAAALAVMWSALVRVFPAVSAKWRVWLLVLAAANPIVIWQLPSAYNDYCLWVETLLLLSAFVLLWKDAGCRYAYLVVFLTMALGINTKFTHFFYIGLECLLFAVWCLFARKIIVFKYGLLTVVAALVVGISLIGYNPYVCNTLDFPSPFYPLIGSPEVDIMTDNTPEMYSGGNRFVNFFKSLLSVEASPWGLVNGKATLSGIVQSYAQSMRVNGFGILMSPMLLLGFLLMWVNKPSRGWWVLYALVFALSFCFDQSWWARYIPFLWLALVVPVVLSLCSPARRSRTNRLLRGSLIVLCVVNATVFAGAACGARLAYTRYIDYVFATQHRINKPVHVVGLTAAMRQQFRERGVPVVEHECLEKMTDPKALFRVFGFDFFDAFMELPESDYPLLYRKPDNLLDRMARYDRRRLQGR